MTDFIIFDKQYHLADAIYAPLKNIKIKTILGSFRENELLT